MSAPPSIIIDNVQVAEIEKNSMTLFIEISGKSLAENCQNKSTTGHWSRREVH